MMDALLRDGCLAEFDRELVGSVDFASNIYSRQMPAINAEFKCPLVNVCCENINQFNGNYGIMEADIFHAQEFALISPAEPYNMLIYP
jgi:hypothetical protein